MFGCLAVKVKATPRQEQLAPHGICRSMGFKGLERVHSTKFPDCLEHRRSHLLNNGSQRRSHALADATTK